MAPSPSTTYPELPEVTSHYVRRVYVLEIGRTDVEALVRSMDINVAALLEKYAAGNREFPNINLRGADLSEAMLGGIDLTGAVLKGAELMGADLSQACLKSANLRGADLSGALLNDCDLSGADLRGSELMGADVRGANLSGARLQAADYDRYTRFDRTVDPVQLGLNEVVPA